MYHFNNFRSGLRGFSVAPREYSREHRLYLGPINTVGEFFNVDFLTIAAKDKVHILSTGSRVSTAYSILCACVTFVSVLY